ncbi:hypothetical protein ACHAQA_010124 [Verticillium albo-atrum]
MRLSIGLSLLAAAAASAAAIPSPKKQETSGVSKILVGAPGQILVADFDGTSFEFTANSTLPGTTASWMAFKEPNLIYAVDENSANLRLFTYDAATNALKLEKTVVGSAGVVHLEFNVEKTRLHSGEGQVDVWDIADGKFDLLTQVVSDGALGPNKERQDQPRVHQVVRETSGRFFAANDLGTDTVLLLDSADDSFDIANPVRVEPAGCGPRHGVFVPAADGKTASHYVLVCEMLNLLQVFEVGYADNSIQFAPVQTLSTFGNTTNFNTTTAKAGAISISDNGKDIYVSNRLTGIKNSISGNPIDSIAHFRVASGDGAAGTECGRTPLQFAGLTSSLGEVPRMFSLSKDNKFLLSSNQERGFGLLAFERVEATGKLLVDAAAKVNVQDFGPQGFGPQFVQQIA